MEEPSTLDEKVLPSTWDEPATPLHTTVASEEQTDARQDGVPQSLTQELLSITPPPNVLAEVDQPIKTEEPPINLPTEPSPPQPASRRSPSPDRKPASRHRRCVPLTSLLSHADALFALYPPTHPALAVGAIMGPQSVVFTWSEDARAIADDDDAEAMVAHTELMVLPYEESDAEDAGAHESEEKAKKKEKDARRRKRLRKPRRFTIERRTAVAGAVLVLGVAFAVYGIRATGPYAAVMGKGHGHERDWKKAGRWAGGMLLGASERLIGGFGL